MIHPSFATTDSVIVRHLDIGGVPPDPSEACTPLIVDPNAHLSGPIAFQGFEPVAGWITEVCDSHCRIKLTQLSERPILNIAREPAGPPPVPNFLGLLVPE
jgi:hypothetical protein